VVRDARKKKEKIKQFEGNFMAKNVKHVENQIFSALLTTAEMDSEQTVLLGVRS